MRLGYIYGLRCPLSGEIRYIGQTIKKLNKRLCEHKSDKRHNQYKINWIQKLEKLELIDSLKIELLEECLQKDLNDKEKLWIKKYKDNGNKLVNLTDGGDGTFGHICSDETKEKLRITSTGKKLTDKSKKKISDSKKGIKLTKKHKNDISLSLKKAYDEGRKKTLITEEQKEKISQGLKKYFLENPKSKKEKIAKETKIRVYSDEEKKAKSEKISGEKNPFYGKKHTIEALKKMSDNKKCIYDGEKNPFYGKAHSDKTKSFLSNLHENKLKRKILMIDDDDQIIREFSFLDEINNFLNVKYYYNSLRHHLDKNKKFKGYYWKKL